MPPRSKPHTYAEILREVRGQLEAGGIDDWEASAEWLVTEAIGCTRTTLFSQPQATVPSDILAKLDLWVARRLRHEPVQYIVGYTEFCDLKLHVDSRVLIPRPETEELVDCVATFASTFARPRILDVGTGSGCIAIALAARLSSAEVVAVDKSESALEVARKNAVVNGRAIRIVRWDVLGGQPDFFDKPFDLIVSNPPYIPSDEMESVMPDVANFEPAEALFVDGDPLLFYKAILEFADAKLTATGGVFFEVNPDFAEELAGLMKRHHGFPEPGIERDLGGHQRIVWGRREG